MSDFAWVTLATNDSYSLGALVLAHSLKQVGTKHQMVVLITPGVTNAMREKLTTVFNIVEEVNPLDSKDEANLKLLKRPELGITFTKLHCWRLIQFQKCVFLDADTLVLSNSDELFERDEFSAAPDVGWPDCFNSGVFVYKPSNETYSKLVDFALLKGSFDGGDQGLLNLYFSDWAHKDIAKHLPFIYNMCSTAVYSYLPAFKQYGKNAKIVHFIGPAKPWLQYFNTETLKVYPSPGLQHLEETLQKWWNIFCSLIHPNLSKDMSGLAGAFAQFTLGAKRTTGQDALENHLRRQAWELGNIDYLGRDSFDHIWSKICESLATPTQEASGEQKAETMVPEVVGDVPTTITTTPETCITAMKNEPTPADVLLKEIIPIPIEAIQTISAESPKPEEKSSPPQPSPADILLKEIIPVPIEAMQKQPIPKPDDSTPKSDAVAEVEALLKELIPVPIEALKTDETTPVDVTKPADLKLETAPVDVPKPDITPVDVPKPETTPVDVAKPETAPVDVPKSDIAPIDVPKPETAPVVVPKPETAPIDLPKPETAPVDLPKPETAPIDVPKPETAPIDVPKPETAPVDVPKPETAPIDVPKPEITPVDVPKSETALVDVSKTEAAPTETPKEEAPKVETAITELDVSQSVLSQALKSETTPIVAPKPESTPVEAPKDAVLQESIKTEPLPEAPKVETAPIPLEAPKTETPQEAPQPETQVTEVPKADAPKVEALKDEAPKADAPKAEIPVTETPKSESTPVEIPKETLPEKIVQQETAVSTIITPPTPTESNKIETPTMEVGPEMLSKPEVVEVPEAIPEKDRVPPPDSQKQECPMKQKECSKTEEQKSESIPPEVQPQSEIAAAKPSETTEQKPEVTEEVIKKVKVVKKKKVPKSDAPKGDAPKSDASKSDAPKSDAPKSDAPKVDTPKSDAPKSDVGATASEQQPKAGGETSTPTPPPRKTTTVKKVKAKKP
nr:uncharacterized protein LOC111414167 isoform X2 [Onthophagus taurus]